MGNSAIFVDAEYLYAEGGRLCCKSFERDDVLLYGLGANEFLSGLATRVCGHKPLRTYWYDNANQGEATPAQMQLAVLPNMKLRLQTGSADSCSSISSAIRRDMLTLAENQAICDAFLLSGDENLVNCVAEAQDLGLRVTLVKIKDHEEPSCVTGSLRTEVDEVLSLDHEDLSRFIRRRLSPDDTASDAYDPLESVSMAAAQFADNWLNTAPDDEFDALYDQRPRIPESLDSDLLYAVEHVLGGSLRGQDRLRRAVRQAFWERIDQEVGDWPPIKQGL
ncbi:MAG: NYN domain-containing protein [Acidimicrobiaceae bacterium]|nr:NYN domain-containing protein [Acidimicrobiaceae bacterium]MCY4176561.1 NYN domain-containing protein [Acidimicrobiaceae bacterium]MCY4280603.1 NYN domain-containing protein [Acidimicrobiaceae bacterium]MCY4294701.1 NYN domain-containing protein [Acidimicrobiaceae bacterium]